MSQRIVSPNTKIVSFRGPYRFLSNFYHCDVEFEGEIYPTLEHAYQAAKAVSLHHRAEILSSNNPVHAKRFGNLMPCRSGWDDMRVEVMRSLLAIKFSNAKLQQMLLETGEAQLIEGNDWHDQFWGDCHCLKHSGIPGRNQLGKLLMELRKEITK